MKKSLNASSKLYLEDETIENDGVLKIAYRG